MKKLVGLLASLKTAIILISLLTLLSIVGTFIPQKLEAINYIQNFPRSWQFILSMGFDDIYRCNIFIATLSLLSLSAVICVFIRFKATYKSFFSNSENDNNPYVKGKSKASIIGSLMLHLGLVLIFLGGLMGLLFGVEMSISGKAGEKIPVPSLEVIRTAVKADNLSRQARTIRQFDPGDARLDKMREEIEGMHKIYHDGIQKPEFKIAFNKLWMEHYSEEEGAKKGGVKSWNVDIQFMELASGSLFASVSETATSTIKVNYPVSYKNYGFYLSNWNKTWKKIKLKIDYMPNVIGWENFTPEEGLFPQTVEVGISEAFQVKGFPYPMVISNFMPDFRITQEGFFNASPELKNPAAMLLAFDAENNSEVGHTWAFPADKAMMAAHVSNLPLKIEFQSADYEYESMLQMAYDPGKPVVWLGCLLFCLGMMLSLYFPQKKVVE